MSLNPDPSKFYADHISQVCETYERALDNAGADWCLIPSGTLKYAFLDDRSYDFVANPHFKYWLPLTNVPDSFVVFRSGKKPQLLYCQPKDFWHMVPEAPNGYWVEHFDISIIASPDEVDALLPEKKQAAIVIGEVNENEYAGIDRVNPATAINLIHNARTVKSAYEIACMELAQLQAVKGHQAAARAFFDNKSEYDIHLDYCQAMTTRESELPYNSIVALNEHGAVLHYQYLDRVVPKTHLSFLIDAGAQHAGYAADITRTYCTDSAGSFRHLLDGMEQLQLGLIEEVQAGRDYRDLHLLTHDRTTDLLIANEILTCTKELAIDAKLSSQFFPHGLGHLIGLQVHDVAGLTIGDDARESKTPEGHEALRLTRQLKEGHVLTIEPGVYFIPMLLDPLREDAKTSGLLNWSKIDELIPYGGIRIEDEVQVLSSGNRNLTREAFAQLS
ncbi:MAG: Xaa-Pro dipeptidase [Pseudomonadota bacterium]